MIIHTFNTYHFVFCINIILILIYNCYNEDVYLPMELYYLCIDFVFQFIVEKYRNKLNQIKNVSVTSTDVNGISGCCT